MTQVAIKIGLVLVVVWAGLVGVVKSYGSTIYAEVIAYTREITTFDNDIFLLDTERGTTINVTRNEASDHDPALSPNLLQLAFISDRFGPSNVYVTNLGNGQVEVITRDRHARSSEIQWSPNGENFIFVEENLRDALNIVNVTDLQPRVLARFFRFRFLFWTSDSKYVWYLGAESENEHSEIFFRDVSSNQQFPFLDGMSESNPTFSNDGTQLAYILPVEASYHIFILDVMSGDIRQLSQNLELRANPTWSPDGRYLAVVQHDQIYIVNVFNGELEQLTHLPERYSLPLDRYGNLHWSHDGSQIFFVSSHESGAGYFALYAVDVHDKQVRRLTEYERDTFLNYSIRP